VNGQPVTSRLLEHGDEIRAGHSVFVFLVDERAREELDASPERASVELDQGQIAAGATFLLRKENALSLAPGKAIAAANRGEQALRDLEILLRIGAAIREVRDLEALEVQLLA